MLPDRSIPRPTFAPVFAAVATKEVSNWLASHPDFDSSHFANVVEGILTALATETKKDAFAYCETLKTKFEWPVDETLVGIFTSLIKHTDRKALRSAEMDWVMKTGMRWTVPVGDTTHIMCPKNRYHREAKVISIDAVTASATMEFVHGEKDTVKVLTENLVRKAAA